MTLTFFQESFQKSTGTVAELEVTLQDPLAQRGQPGQDHVCVTGVKRGCHNRRKCQPHPHPFLFDPGKTYKKNPNGYRIEYKECMIK